MDLGEISIVSGIALDLGARADLAWWLNGSVVSFLLSVPLEQERFGHRFGLRFLIPTRRARTVWGWRTRHTRRVRFTKQNSDTYYR